MAVAGRVGLVSHTLVAHRLLQLLVPLRWMWTLAEIVLVPLLVDPSLLRSSRLSGRTSGAKDG